MELEFEFVAWTSISFLLSTILTYVLKPLFAKKQIVKHISAIIDTPPSIFIIESSLDVSFVFILPPPLLKTLCTEWVQWINSG